MTGIRLYNTRTRRKEAFAPIDPADIRMYVCGPTVYDRAHLGNARPVVVFDVLFRLLRHVHGADHVTYVRNFTDVDDKINARAREMQAGGDARDLNAIIRALTDQTIAWYHADMDALGTLRPTHEPRATDYIAQMIAMIDTLVARGHAYAAEGHVLFDVRSYARYGRLSGRTVEDMIAGARVEVAPYKRDPMDFVLWKPSAEDEPGWESPWGRGRPGWHIECSAMSRALLGESFDIHGGGIDLQFPHHENEIAQSCCAHPEGEFARVWMHNEMVQVDGRKMSKSLGNFFTVQDLLSGKSEFGRISGPELRILFLLSHYRSPINLTQTTLGNARSILLELCENMAMLGSTVLQNLPAAAPITPVVRHLAADLDTAGALAELRARLRKAKNTPLTIEFLAAAHASLLLLGIDIPGLSTSQDYARMYDRQLGGQSAPQELDRLAEHLASLRADAKLNKDFAKADAFKTALVQAGVEVRIAGQDVTLIRGPDFDPTKLEALK